MRGPGVEDRGGEPDDRLEAQADGEGVEAFAAWAEAWGAAHGFAANTVFAMRLCVEEAATNITGYAYAADAAARPMRLRARLTPLGAAFEIMDEGAPFDVVGAPDPGVEHDIAAATIGGRGIRLMRAFSAHMAYARAGGENRLTIEFLRDTPG